LEGADRHGHRQEGRDQERGRGQHLPRCDAANARTGGGSGKDRGLDTGRGSAERHRTKDGSIGLVPSQDPSALRTGREMAICLELLVGREWEIETGG
jgi:hypothetical protein